MQGLWSWKVLSASSLIATMAVLLQLAFCPPALYGSLVSKAYIDWVNKVVGGLENLQ